ncbi:Gfo/Idh/MocA family protein [Paenibacillus eucommiae]|uniref:Dehydrogenase n=1 Tax=Paenibacillus eucommiae TaxID=1355755 RepID=A0ABS4J247_9BACL|nr:Gfo/Idh/MocA family oxidoreductase [Paenibacillus eucommiae]MBP1993902.1 putative dehydrogenase [Paenibacillus eucommiae]
MKYRAAIVGGGGIAVGHLEALAGMDRIECVAVADVQEERAQKLASTYGIRPYVQYKEMIEREKPDIAVITLPHFLHKEAAVFCAEQGCHVLLEKPMALNTEECDEIIAAVRRSKVTLLVGHTQHYIAENREAKRIMEQNWLGELVMIIDARHTNYFQAQRPRWFLQKELAGGGILTNLGSHSVDKIQWLGGAPIARVRAAVSYEAAEGNVEGSGLVFLENNNGVPATVSQSGYGGAPKDETELIFTKGMIKLHTGQSLWISEGGTYVQVPVEPQEAPFVLQFNDLLNCIETGAEPECSMEYSRSIVAVIQSIYRSHELKEEQTVPM